MTIKAEEIIFKGAKYSHLSHKPKIICEIFSYQPDNIEQMPLGNLYMVAELTLVKDCGHLNNLLASLIRREYYLYPAKGAYNSFQSAIKKANSYLNDLAEQKNLEWLGKLHFFCTCLAKGNIFFTQAGQLKTFLYRQNHLTDLSRKIVPRAEKPHPAKIFASIVSGKIESGDKILLATPNIHQLFSLSGLRQLLTNYPSLASIADQINKVLREQKKPLPLAALLLQIEDSQDTEQESHLPKQTNKTITPPIDLKEILK